MKQNGTAVERRKRGKRRERYKNSRKRCNNFDNIR